MTAPSRRRRAGQAPARLLAAALAAGLAAVAADPGARAAGAAPEQAPPAAAGPGTPPLATAPVKLAARFRSFLEDDTSYLLSDVERLAFLNLTDDRSRDAFVTGFWQARDPSPLTFRNEFRVEHQKRVAEANALFGGRARDRPGWKMARGRIHILLGPPRDRVTYGGETGLHAVEDWFYQAPPDLPGPRFFHVLFFQPAGSEDDALYDPTSDGPEKLVVVAAGSALPDRAQALAALRSVSPKLAAVSLALNPADPGDLEKGTPAADSARLVDQLLDLANRRVVDLSYLEEAGAGRGGQKVAWSARFALKAAFHGDFAPDPGGPGGAGVAHVVVVFPPEALTWRRAGERLLGALHVAGRVEPAGDATTVVLPVDEQVELSLSAAEYEQLSTHPLAFQTLVPLLPGAYRVRLVARNLVSKEVGFTSGEVVIPEPPAADGIALSAILPLAQSIPAQAPPGEIRPFAFGARRVFPLTGEVAPRGKLECAFHLAYPAARRSAGQEYALRYTLLDAQGEERLGGFGRLAVDPAADRGYAAGSVEASLQGLEPGAYVMRVAAAGNPAKGTAAAEAATRDVGFRVGDPGPLNPPWTYARKRSLGPADLALATWRQRVAKGDVAGAIRALGTAIDEPATGAEARLLLADLHLERGEREQAEALVRPLAARGIDPAARVQALQRIGAARAAAGNHAGALSAIEEALRESPRHVRLLNALAASCKATGDLARAREAWERSQELDPEQPEVSAALRALERGKR